MLGYTRWFLTVSKQRQYCAHRHPTACIAKLIRETSLKNGGSCTDTRARTCEVRVRHRRVDGVERVGERRVRPRVVRRVPRLLDEALVAADDLRR